MVRAGYAPHVVTVYNRATIQALYTHILSIPQLLLSGGSIQGTCSCDTKTQQVCSHTRTHTHTHRKPALAQRPLNPKPSATSESFRYNTSLLLVEPVLGFRLHCLAVGLWVPGSGLDLLPGLESSFAAPSSSSPPLVEEQYNTSHEP